MALRNGIGVLINGPDSPLPLHHVRMQGGDTICELGRKTSPDTRAADSDGDLQPPELRGRNGLFMPGRW